MVINATTLDATSLGDLEILSSLVSFLFQGYDGKCYFRNYGAKHKFRESRSKQVYFKSNA